MSNDEQGRVEGTSRIAVVLGTRAQLIKTAPVMRLMEDAGLAYRYIYTAQHRETLDDIRRDFGIKAPDYVLFAWDDEAKTIARFGGWMLRAFFQLVTSRRKILPWRDGVVITHGDTASTFWGALLGRLTGNRVMHLESGLRSFNLLQPFPEEILRLLTFRLTDIHACPNETAMKNLHRYRGEKINTECNTLYDAVRSALESTAQVDLPAMTASRYAVASIHRFENIFKSPRFERILRSLEETAENTPVVFVLHPATERQLDRRDFRRRLEDNPRIELCKRMSFFGFQKLLSGSEFVITDGGSNQEELFYMGKPTLILRDVTERGEGLGSNAVLAAWDEQKIREFVANYQDFKKAPYRTTTSPSELVVLWLADALRRNELNDPFDPNAYWRSRVGRDATIGVVGHRSLGTAYNEYIYRRRLVALNSILAEMGVTPDQQSILDIGCGSGFYTDFWQRHGVSKYHGVDLSSATLQRLRAEFPNYDFTQVDITEPPGDDSEQRKYSIITVFDVFYHIVEDSKFLGALQNISRQLAPDGVVIVLDQLSNSDYMLRKHVKFRGRESYRSLLHEADIEIVESRKLFSFLAPPIFGIKPVDITIAGLYKGLGICMTAIPALGKLFGKLLYEFDKLLFRLGMSTPNHELFVLRKRSERTMANDV